VIQPESNWCGSSQLDTELPIIGLAILDDLPASVGEGTRPASYCVGNRLLYGRVGGETKGEITVSGDLT
jgi:hypothetical protein